MVGTLAPLRIDYQRLKTHMTEPRVNQDLTLAGVRGVDHFLSFFVFDEAAFTEFVRDVPPTTDDRTVIDFTAPRFSGSGFGLGQYTASVSTRDGNSFGVGGERQAYYLSRRRSVVPYSRTSGTRHPKPSRSASPRARASRSGSGRSRRRNGGRCAPTGSRARDDLTCGHRPEISTCARSESVVGAPGLRSR